MRNGNLLVDHVFMLVEAAEVNAAVQALAAVGLQESSRRSHPGLGTSNIFFCFDNAFLELLWVVNREEARRTRLGQMLLERLDGRLTGAAPFGFGFRTTSPEESVPFDTWIYEPPQELGYKPIPIAQCSGDPRQPLLFRAQRQFPPSEWTDGNAGARQTAAGLAVVAPAEPEPELELVLELGPEPAVQVLLAIEAPYLPTRAAVASWVVAVRLPVRLRILHGAQLRQPANRECPGSRQRCGRWPGRRFCPANRPVPAWLLVPASELGPVRLLLVVEP